MLEVLGELYDERLITGIQVAAYHGGRCVVSACAGTLGTADPRPVQPDSLFNCFSVMKGITATALHILADQHLLAYDDLVAAHWPVFGQRGKEQTTIRHVLTHRAGLHKFPGLQFGLKELCDFHTMLRLLEEATPTSVPGEQAQYHVLSFGWLVGGIVEAATKGQPFAEFVRQRIAAPLGVDDEFMIGVDTSDDTISSRIATLVNGFASLLHFNSAERGREMSRERSSGRERSREVERECVCMCVFAR